MEYIHDINIREAVVHILDSSGEEPVLNEYSLELNDDTYKFLYKHIEKCLKDEELKYAVFNPERNIVKEIVKDYLNGIDNNLIDVSKELSRQLFAIMKGNVNIQSCDLLTVSLITDQGPMLAILKMDYVKNFTHKIDFVDNKIDIGIVQHLSGLPGSSQKIQKAAFIKPIREKSKFDLYVLDKQRYTREDDEYGANYFTNSFLGGQIVSSERDITKTFLAAVEIWTRSNIQEDAGQAEKIRTIIKSKLKADDVINVGEVSEELFKDEPEKREDFTRFVKGQGIEEVNVDKTWIEKKLKRVRLKIDKDIELYINEEAYDDESRFEIVNNGDGSISIVIKHIMNYIEK